jgi:hypothetical protein
MRVVTESIREVAVKLVEDKLGQTSDGKDKSVLGALSESVHGAIWVDIDVFLVKSETASSRVHMSVEEIQAQVLICLLRMLENVQLILGG